MKYGQANINNEIYLLIKYIKSLLWRVVKCLSYIEEARCLKVKWLGVYHPFPSNAEVKERVELYFYTLSGSSWSLIGRNLHLESYLLYFP